MTVASDFSRNYRADSFTKKENRIMITANEDECKGLAVRLEVISINNLKASFVIKTMSSGEIEVSGLIYADVGQTCVITNEPIETSLALKVASRFLNSEKILAFDENEAEFDLAEDDLPDPIIDGQIDLGEFISQHLSLGIDPYPKAKKADFKDFSTNTDHSNDEKQSNPFAILSKIKDKL